MDLPVRVIDSITELRPEDCGCIAVSGSHGGRSSAHYALAARPFLSVFNDAGVGRDHAGIIALDLLEAQGLAACTVAHHSARIGEAQSTWADGVISHVNQPARKFGLSAGQRLQPALQSLQQQQLQETAP